LNAVYRPIALDEAAEAKAWHRQFDKGDDFLDDLDRAIQLALEFPEIGRRANKRGTRRVLLSRFPYALFYRVRGDTMEILAVYHTSRDPKKLRGRLR
jgi:plasmid stabilization system protein ParE